MVRLNGAKLFAVAPDLEIDQTNGSVLLDGPGQNRLKFENTYNSI